MKEKKKKKEKTLSAEAYLDFSSNVEQYNSGILCLVSLSVQSNVDNKSPLWVEKTGLCDMSNLEIAQHNVSREINRKLGKYQFDKCTMHSKTQTIIYLNMWHIQANTTAMSPKDSQVLHREWTLVIHVASTPSTWCWKRTLAGFGTETNHFTF